MGDIKNCLGFCTGVPGEDARLDVFASLFGAATASVMDAKIRDLPNSERVSDDKQRKRAYSRILLAQTSESFLFTLDDWKEKLEAWERAARKNTFALSTELRELFGKDAPRSTVQMKLWEGVQAQIKAIAAIRAESKTLIDNANIGWEGFKAATQERRQAVLNDGVSPAADYALVRGAKCGTMAASASGSEAGSWEVGSALLDLADDVRPDGAPQARAPPRRPCVAPPGPVQHRPRRWSH